MGRLYWGIDPPIVVFNTQKTTLFSPSATAPPRRHPQTHTQRKYAIKTPTTTPTVYLA